MFISVTTTEKGTFGVEVKQISRIVELTGGAAKICMKNSEDGIEPTETFTDIWNQQNTSNKNLNMVLITNQRTGNREIWFTHDLKMIVAEPGGGSKLIQKNSRMETIVGSETVAAILAYQGATKNLGIISATVVPPSGANYQALFMDHYISEINPVDPATPANGSLIKLKGSQHTLYQVTETVAALFAAQPA